MIDIIQEYWKSLLWTDGYRFTGVAITLWLLILSVTIGGCLAILLAIARVSLTGLSAFRSGSSPTSFAARRSMCSCWCSTPACTRWRL